jgi:single-strand DNA-binding protein
MEQLNRIELRGTVGSVYVKSFGNEKVTNFSVATNYSYVSKDGSPVIETTWHNVVAWENGSMPMDLIEKGTQVGVQGRLRCRRYVGENGEPRTCYEVIASNVEILP